MFFFVLPACVLDPLTKLSHAVEVQEISFQAPETVWCHDFDRSILASFLSFDERIKSEIASLEDGSEDGGGDRSTPFYKLVETLRGHYLDLRSALTKLKLHVESRRKDGLNKVPRGALKRWTSIKSHFEGNHKSAEDEVSDLYSAVYDSVNALLIVLISIYHAVPEIHASYPKIFRLLGSKYSKRRTFMRDEILRSAALLTALRNILSTSMSRIA